MNVLCSWINEIIDTGMSAEQIAETLSDLGLPYEGMETLDGDCVIDVEITSNRGDCLGHIGIARELAAVTGAEVKKPQVSYEQSDASAADMVTVQIDEPDLCHRYTARVIEGVKVGPSPDWVVKRLEAIGMRSVNNVVDATNLAMMETGQPPHAFDYDKIKGQQIIVRKAKQGEEIVSIDGTKCKLDPEMLVIADAEEPVALAGVMGGLHTEVGESTTTVLLEDAYFDPVQVRTTSRKLALPSDASFRFERIVDKENIDWASQRTAQLICELAGGKVAKGVVDAYPVNTPKPEVTMRLSRFEHLIGIKIAPERVLEILSRLCFDPRLDGDIVTCTCPSWRSDISREADLIEEVIRVHGYNQVPTEKKIEIEVASKDARESLTQMIASSLNSCGFYETINVTFVGENEAKLFCGDAPHLTTMDSLGKGTSILRQTLLPSLMGVLRTNLNAKITPSLVFEIANTFIPAENDPLPEEKTKIGLAGDCDLRLLRGTIEKLVEQLDRRAKVRFESTDINWAKAGANILVGDTNIGLAGVVSDAICNAYDIKNATPVAAQLDLEALASLQTGPLQVDPVAKFPAIQRDLSLLLEESVRWEDIENAIHAKANEQLEDVEFVEIYRGKGIPKGSKSLTLSLRFRDAEGTMTHEEVDALEKPIVENILAVTSGKLREM